jgi:hypothetical protein
MKSDLKMRLLSSNQDQRDFLISRPIQSKRHKECRSNLRSVSGREKEREMKKTREEIIMVAIVILAETGVFTE